MGAGRPTKYKPEYCKVAVDFLAQGKSIIQLSAEIDVGKATIYRWAEENPEFRDALQRGQELSEAFWQSELVNMMYSKDINAPLVKLYFANRFNWHDKKEVDNKSSDGSMTPTKIERVIIDNAKD